MHLFSLILLILNLSFAADLELKTPQGGDFTLQTSEGKLTSRELRGKDVFLFFGFIRCPDVCPLTLRRIKSLSEKLTPEEKKNFRFIFISVDTERDDLSQLKALKKIYGDSYIGAIGTDKELSELAASYGARFRRFKTKKGKLIVDHTDSVFYLDKEGKWTATIPHETNADEMLAVLRTKKNPGSTKTHPARRAKLIGANPDCDLSVKACTVKAGKETFTLELTPRPVTIEKNFDIRLTTDSRTLIPKEVDFEGISLNMGHLRPSLSEKAPGSFGVGFRLPVCELPQMEWKVRVIVHTADSEWRYLDYKLTTFQ